MDCRKLTGGRYCGFWKAFETVDHAVMIEKMKALGVHGVELKGFKYYLF